MVIFFLDYATQRCMRVRPRSDKSEREWSDKELVAWVEDHADEIGFKPSQGFWMATDNEEVTNIEL